MGTRQSNVLGKAVVPSLRRALGGMAEGPTPYFLPASCATHHPSNNAELTPRPERKGVSFFGQRPNDCG